MKPASTTDGPRREPATPAGDPLPHALATYYRALDEGRFKEASRAFSDDTLYALPRADALETDARAETEGRTALLARLRARGRRPYEHVILLCLDGSSSCLLEGVTRHVSTGHTSASFAASVQFDGNGLISRYLAYMCKPAVVRSPLGRPRGEAFAEATSALARYFNALDRGEFGDAAACFGPEIRYSHPPYRHTGIKNPNRVEFRGRDDLLAAFRVRGRQSFVHRIVAAIQRGPHCMVEGRVEGLPTERSGSFVSSLTLGGDGLIDRYVSFYCEPSVRRS